MPTRVSASYCGNSIELLPTRSSRTCPTRRSCRLRGIRRRLMPRPQLIRPVSADCSFPSLTDRLPDLPPELQKNAGSLETPLPRPNGYWVHASLLWAATPTFLGTRFSLKRRNWWCTVRSPHCTVAHFFDRQPGSCLISAEGCECYCADDEIIRCG